MAERPRVVVAGEDHAHRVLGQQMLDAALLSRQRGGWPERDQLDQAREWTGLADAPDAPVHERFYRVQRLDDDLRAAGGGAVRRVNRINGQPAGHAAWFIGVYQLFALREPRVEAIIVIDDADGGRSTDADARRAEEYLREQGRARDPEQRGPAVAFGVASPAAEGWALRLLRRTVPNHRDEAKRHLRAHLGLERAPVAPPGELLAEALDGCAPGEVDDADLLRFWANLCDHVAPALLR